MLVIYREGVRGSVSDSMRGCVSTISREHVPFCHHIQLNRTHMLFMFHQKLRTSVRCVGRYV